MTSKAQLNAERLPRPPRQTLGKRKRVSVACKGCRMRKARCDGGHPKCTACIELDSNCHYEQPRVQQTSSADDRLNLALEERVRAIEQKLYPSEISQHLDNQSPPRQQPRITGEINLSGISSPTVNRTWTNRSAHFGRTFSPDIREDRVDGMGAVALTDATELNEFYGASSNISFLKCVTEAMELATNSNDFSSSTAQIPIEPTWSPEDMISSTTEEAMAPLDEQSLASSTVDLFALPSPTESDTLIRLYFSAVGLMIPCIQEGPFLETYRQVRKMGTQSARRSWLGLFNMILAMAANITTPTSPTKERAEDSELYFNRALELAKPLILGYITFETVDQLYDQNLEFGTHLSIDDTLCRTFKLRLNLAQWQQTLPLDLQIIKSTDPAQIFSSRLENTRFRVLLSLRLLSTQILVFRPILQRSLDVPKMQAAGELRLKPLRDYGFSALRDLVNICIDIFFISNNILAGSNRNLNLGAWWFSGYYTFNASLAILGVLLVEKSNLIPEISLSLSVAELRASLSNALDILRGLDNGNIMISKCQSTLKRLLHDYNKLEPTTPKHATSFSPTQVPTAADTNLGSVGSYSQMDTNASLAPMNLNFGTFGGFTIDANHNFFNPYSLDS
ncbi:Zn(II)2Cys6 transcription factor [Penicillium cf. griseofulvum]|uniref:Zn(II)2Cys6 transcription factor n=1 Tax=Penicillium cf. griseofulvum TaxID=2972120 RepID=A0A9W9IT70_9EURO|nr:Zn(II)2Cys6 transcription factor [Penicillium cf. griseofulvum]KAJ5430509.1 Zn(II)2Cys6 transcription factor [Penicillium cf. griseofulvum]